MRHSTKLPCFNLPDKITTQAIKESLQVFSTSIQEHLIYLYLKDDDLQKKLGSKPLANNNNRYNHYVKMSKEGGKAYFDLIANELGFLHLIHNNDLLLILIQNGLTTYPYKNKTA